MSVSKTAFYGLAITPLVATVALGQTNPGGTASALETIVVTAERREENLQSTPVSVTAFTPEQLATKLLTRTEQLADFVPNMYMHDGISNPSTLSVVLRGQGEGGGGIATSEPPVAFYVDDIYQARLSVTNTEFADVERVEVLRGPQGTLYGRNSMTGAVNIVTATPGDLVRLNAAASYGSFHETKLKAMAAGPITDGVLAASLSAVYSNQSQGWWRSVATGQRVGEKKTWGVRGKLHLYSNDAFDAVVAAYYVDATNDGFITTPVDSVTLKPLDGDYFITRSPIASFGSTEQWGVNGRFTLDLGGAKLKSITAYSGVGDGFRFDLSGGVRTPPNVYRVGFDRTSRIDQDQWSQELQLVGDAFHDRLNWIVGGYFFTEKGTQRFADIFFIAAANLALPLPITNYTMKTRSYAGFMQGTYALTNRLSFTAGLRYTEEHKSIAGTKAIPFSNRTKYNATTPKFSLDYKLSDSILLFASASRGFKAGGYQGLSGDAVSLATPFGAEHAWNYEIGTKSDLFDRRLRVNATAYFLRLTDLQSAVLVPGTINAVTQNAVDAESWGLELESIAALTSELSLTFMLGLQDDKFTRVNPNSQIAISGAKRLASAPRYQGAVGLNYRTPLSTFGLAAPGYFRFAGDFVFRDVFWASFDLNPVAQNSKLHRFNGLVGYESESGSWQATLSARNITDHVDWLNGLDVRSLFGQGVRQAMEPRTWMLEVKYKY
jgi:iron complex outermembrane receptor protein